MAPPNDRGPLFAGLFGLLLGVGLLKFGNPVILDPLVTTPASLDEWRAFAWPIRFGYLGLGAVAAVGAWQIGFPWRPTAPRWILALLGGWILWQVVATIASEDRQLSGLVLTHFLACGLCFALGHLALSRVAQPRTFWLCLAAGLVGVIGMGMEQHFGGLEATRRMILQGSQAASLSPEYLARIHSNRIFSTLVYPNALAGVLLLLLPAASVLAWNAGSRWGVRGSQCLAGSLFAAGLAVLVWSGSKAGWLIAMGLAVLVLFLGPWKTRAKIVVTLLFVLSGLAGFGWVFREKLSRGPTSVSARFDYWTAAVDGFLDRPVLGHGPGLFKRVYAARKRPDSEMAQLTHNDYLQQATDSGFPGFLGYLGFVGGSLAHLYRQRIHRNSPLTFGVGLGLLGWFLQGVVEFGLYIPAAAWCAFGLLGWLLAQKPSDAPR
ncbi:MAG: O-antigen ligase family protein [Limisphaerales bacterium]